MTTIRRAAADTGTMAKRNFLKSISSPDKLIENVAAPVVTMLVFVFVLGGALEGITGSMSYVNYIVPGILILCIAQCSTTTAIGVSMDIQKGILDRFRSMPIAQSSVLAGRVLEAVLRTMLTVLLLVLAAFAVGFRPRAGFAAWAGAAALLLLFSATITWVSVVYGLLVKSAEGAGSFTMFLMLFTYLSSGFIPTETLPAVLRVFAEYQPMTPLIEAVRGLLLGTPFKSQLITAIIWCAALHIIAFIAAMQLYKKKLAK